MVSGTFTFYIKVLVEVVCFCFAFYALTAINYEKLLKPNKVFEAQLLYIMLSICIGHLTAQFIISLIYKLNIW